MSMIGELISNIHKYGNSKLYMKSQINNINNVLEFFVDNNGNLNVVMKKEVYDKPYWDGSKIDSSAIMKRTLEEHQYSSNDLDMNIATVICCTFYDKKTILKKQEEPVKVNTDKAVNIIYQMANSMLQLSNNDLAHWVTGTNDGIINMMINKASQCIISEDIKPASVLIDNIESQVKDVYARLKKVHNVWKEMNGSRTDKEYKAACKKWEILYNDEGETKNNPSQKK